MPQRPPPPPVVLSWARPKAPVLVAPSPTFYEKKGHAYCRVCVTAVDSKLIAKPKQKNKTLYIDGRVPYRTPGDERKSRVAHQTSDFHLTCEALLNRRPAARMCVTAALALVSVLQTVAASSPPGRDRAPIVVPELQEEEVTNDELRHGLFAWHSRLYVDIRGGRPHASIIAGLAAERLQGVPLPPNNQYLNRPHITAMLEVWKNMVVAESIASVSRTVQEGMPLFLLLDGSEVGGEESYTFRLRWVSDDCRVVERCLGLVSIEAAAANADQADGDDADLSASGKTLFDMLVSLLHEYGLQIQHLCGIIADDGSAISGQKTGLHGRIEEAVGAPSLYIKDVGHRIQNCVEKPLKTDPDFKYVSDTVRAVQTIFRQSGLMRRTLKRAVMKKGGRAYKPCGSWRIRWQAKWCTSLRKAGKMREHWVTHLRNDQLHSRAASSKNKTASQKGARTRARRALATRLQGAKFKRALEYFSKFFELAKRPQLVAQYRAERGANVIPYLLEAQLQLRAFGEMKKNWRPGCHGELVKGLHPKSILCDHSYAAALVAGVAYATGVTDSSANEQFESLYYIMNNTEATSTAMEHWLYIKEGRIRDDAELSFASFWKLRQEELCSRPDYLPTLRTIRGALCMASPTSSACEGDFGILRNRTPAQRSTVGVEKLSDELLVKRCGPDPDNVEATRDFIHRGMRIFFAERQRRAPGGGRKRKAEDESEPLHDIAKRLRQSEIDIFAEEPEEDEEEEEDELEELEELEEDEEDEEDDDDDDEES